MLVSPSKGELLPPEWWNYTLPPN